MGDRHLEGCEEAVGGGNERGLPRAAVEERELADELACDARARHGTCVILRCGKGAVRGAHAWARAAEELTLASRLVGERHTVDDWRERALEHDGEKGGWLACG